MGAGLLAADGSPNTSIRLVSLTMGGNDTEFVPVVITCLLTPHCQDTWGPVVSRLIRHTEPRLRQMYKQILRDAPNAQVYVLGYPRILAAHPAPLCQHVTGLDGIQPAEAKWLNDMAVKLDHAISAAVSQAGGNRIHYMSTLNAFSGGEACSRSNSTAGAFMNGVVPLHPEYRFHPSRAGQQLLASLLAHAVRSQPTAWAKAMEVPGTAALNAGGDVGVGPVSCASAGNCVAPASLWGRRKSLFLVAEE